MKALVYTKADDFFTSPEDWMDDAKVAAYEATHKDFGTIIISLQTILSNREISGTLDFKAHIEPPNPFSMLLFRRFESVVENKLGAQFLPKRGTDKTQWTGRRVR